MGDWPTEVRWFQALGTCRCRKPAHGWLMGPRNEKWAAACTSCAAKALKAADRYRAALQPEGEKPS